MPANTTSRNCRDGIDQNDIPLWSSAPRRVQLAANEIEIVINLSRLGEPRIARRGFGWIRYIRGHGVGQATAALRSKQVRTNARIQIRRGLGRLKAA